MGRGDLQRTLGTTQDGVRIRNVSQPKLEGTEETVGTELRRLISLL